MVVFRLSTEVWSHRIASTSIRHQIHAHPDNSKPFVHEANGVCVPRLHVCARDYFLLCKKIMSSFRTHPMAMRHSLCLPMGQTSKKIEFLFSTEYVKLVSPFSCIRKSYDSRTNTFVCCCIRTGPRIACICIVLVVLRVRR